MSEYVNLQNGSMVNYEQDLLQLSRLLGIVWEQFLCEREDIRIHAH